MTDAQQRDALQAPAEPLNTRLLPFAWGSPGRDLARSSAKAVGIRAAGAAFGFLFNVVLARALGREGTGIVMFYLNFATMMGLIATAGMDVVGLRELSRRSETAAIDIIGQIFCNALLSAVVFAAGGFVFLLAFGASMVSLGGAGICAISAVILVLSAFQKNLADWLIALLDFAASQITFYFINRVVSAILLLTGVLLAGALAPDPETCIAMYAAGLFFAVLFGACCVFAHFGRGEIVWKLSTSVPLFRDGISCAIQNVAFIMLNLSPFILLGAVSNTSEVALFGVSQRLVALMVLAITTVSQFAMRDFARASGLRDYTALAQSLTASMRLTFVIAIAIAAILIEFAPVWVSVFGRQFAGAAPTLALLSAGICAQCLGMPFQSALLATNHERAARNVTIASAAVGITLNVLLIPHWGAEGAALGTGIGLALQSLLHGARVLTLLPVHFDLSRLRIIAGIVRSGVL